MPRNFWNVVFLALGLVLAFVGVWQYGLVSWTVAPHDLNHFLLFTVPLVVKWLGFFLALEGLRTWQADQPLWDNLFKFAAGFSMVFLGSIIFDLYASPYVNLVWDKMTFYVPIGFNGFMPMWRWDATALLWGHAYVLFFLLEWVGFVVAWAGMWTWKD